LKSNGTVFGNFAPNHTFTIGLKKPARKIQRANN
jgi:hypothetical protein